MASFNYPVIADNVGGLASLNSKRAPALFSDPGFVRVPSTTLRPVVRSLPANTSSQPVPQTHTQQQRQGLGRADMQRNGQIDLNGIGHIDNSSAEAMMPQQNKEYFGFVKNHPYLAGIVFLLLCMFALVGYFYYKHNGENEQKCKTGDVSDISSGVVAPAPSANTTPDSQSAEATSASSATVAGFAASGAATKPIVVGTSDQASVPSSTKTEILAGVSSGIINSNSNVAAPSSKPDATQIPPQPYTQEQLQQFMLLVKSNPQMLSAYRRQMQVIMQVQRQQLMEQYKQMQNASEVHV